MQRHEAQDWDELRPRGTYDDEYLHEDLPELAEAVASPFATCRRNRKVLERLNALVTRADPGSRVLIMARRVYQAGLVDPGAEKRLVEGYRSARLVELGVLQRTVTYTLRAIGVRRRPLPSFMLSRDDTLSRQLVVLLRRLAKPNERSTKIRQFQDTVWSSTELILDETVDRSLRDVAYYLDIYESDSARRAEDQSLHAVTKLQAVIREALAGLALTLRRDCTT